MARILKWFRSLFVGRRIDVPPPTPCTEPSVNRTERACMSLEP